MQIVKPSRYPGWRTMSSVERRNAKMNFIFAEARRLEAEKTADNHEDVSHDPK